MSLNLKQTQEAIFKKWVRHLFPLLVCSGMALGLSSCGLANAAVNAPGTLFKGMSGALARTVGMGADNTPMEKPLMDEDAMRYHREALEHIPETQQTNQVPSIARMPVPEVSAPVL